MFKDMACRKVYKAWISVMGDFGILFKYVNKFMFVFVWGVLKFAILIIIDKFEQSGIRG